MLGRYFNDWVMNFSIRRNNGVFEAESRLWWVCSTPHAEISLLKPDDRTCYLAVPLYICGFVLLGASFQNHLSIAGLILGWGIAEVAVMINTVAICECPLFLARNADSYALAADAYVNDCFPRLQVCQLQTCVRMLAMLIEFRARTQP